MTDINNLLNKLNEEQIKPVLETEGAVLVVAGAGSGKTRVLTTRIAYLIIEKNISPDNILAITFTNKAANEMKDRLLSIVDDISNMWVCTIHSMCVKILRRDIDKIGFDKNFTIYDDTDKEKILKRIFEELGYDKDKLLKTFKNMISSAKNDCLSPEEYKKVNSEMRFIDEFTNVYINYEDELARSNALDFDDLLYRTYELFSKHNEVADYYSNKFQYIHIDEFQDTNKVQFLIAQRLSIKHGNIFVVGDDDQSIYGWRGAKIENILSFDDLYRGAKIFKLERNYRSTKKILSLANDIIANNKGRRPKELWTDNSDGVKPELFVGTDENNEASYIAIQIKNLMARYPNYSYKDFAVFMRVNALSRAFEQEFNKYNIPYKIYGGFRFFERKEIKDLLSYLKVVNNNKDDESFLRCISFPKRGIGDKSLNELKEYAKSHELSLYEAIDFIDLTSLGSAVRIKLKNFKALLVGFYEYSKHNSVADLIQNVINATGFNEEFNEKDDENNDRLLNISELKNSAEEFAKINVDSTLADYLNSVTLSSDTDDINSDNAVIVATIHAVKGLEFPCVFIAGLDEKILPILRSYSDESELEEERRLMYVAVTRARERLYLTRANSRYMYGSREFMVPSRFINEGKRILSPTFVEKKSINNNSYNKESPFNRRENFFNSDLNEERTSTHGYSSSYASRFLNESKPKVATTNTSGKQYKSGVKVKHPKFGNGTVIDVKGEGENLIVDVAFPGFGIKSLSAKFAPMEII